jgi:GntR family transcriptional regulator
MTSELVRDSAVPMYRQLKVQLRSRIESGELESGSRVPSENELASAHGVSRATARHALAELESEGWLVRIVGKGTFVAHRTRVDRVTGLTGFGENMRAIGRVPGYRVLSMASVVPTREDAERLELPIGESAHQIVRLHSADDAPVAIADSLLPTKYLTQAEASLTRQELTRTSLYTLLEDRLGVRLFRAIEEVEPGTATPEEARLLKVDAKAPLLRVTRIVYDHNDRPIELVRMAYVASRFRYRAELFRKPAAAGPVALEADRSMASTADERVSAPVPPDSAP